MHSRLARSATAVALASSATTFAYVGSAAPAQAAGYNGYCKTSSGVTVVVDFRNLGGGIAIRCAQVGSGATGLDALQAAGIPVQGTRQYGLAFVCRLYGQPSQSATLPGGYHEQCARTPPNNAHWWYEQAPNGGSWSSSGEGVATSHVIPGGFEGFAFSEGGTNYAPRLTPTRPAAPKPAPTHTTTRPPAPPRHTTTTAPKHDPAPSKHAGGTSVGSQPKSTTAPTAAEKKAESAKAEAAKSKSAKAKASASASKSVSASRSSKGSSGSAGATGTSSGGPTNVAGAPVANSDDLIKDSKKKSSGVNATTVVGGIVLAALVIGGGAVAIIRRRSLGQ